MIHTSDFVLLVPTYNPPKGWEYNFLDKYELFKAATNQDFMVVLINDGSTIDISVAVSYLSAKIGSSFLYLGYETNIGKGGALKHGAAQIAAKKYIFTDIDFPYSTESMKRIWDAMLSRSGIIIGHRENAYYTDLSSLRILLSKGLRWLNKLILNLPVNDTQCGLKAFDSEVKDILIHCQTNRFLIDLELLLAVNKRSIHIHPVTVELRPDIDFTKFDSSILIKELSSFVKLVWKYRIR